MNFIFRAINILNYFPWINGFISRVKNTAMKHKVWALFFATIILGGGVTANKELRKQFKTACKKSGFQLLVPPSLLSTDNAAMAAAAAYFNRQNIMPWKKIEAKANLRI